ncbi:MAG: lamin tail domain-containing protein [Phycisphaerales bacterium]|nr:MAG: lamin tail domain-containing protein [Phycisphaerales bacterium]
MIRSSRAGALVILAGFCLASAARGKLVITEIMSQSAHIGDTDCDWWELTNTGPGAVNLLGYSWDDDHMRIGQNTLANITIGKGESVIFCDSVAPGVGLWKWDWALGPEVKVYDPSYFGWTFSSLGSADGIYLFDSSGTLVASASYPSRLQGFSNAWNTEGVYLGISVNAENGAYRSSNASPDVGSPGYAVFESSDTFVKTVYWTDKNIGRISRVNYNGGGVETLLTPLNGLVEPRGLAIDIAAGKMYWADTLTNAIYSADMDGSNIVELVDGLSAPADIALDAGNGWLYWSNSWTGKIQRTSVRGPGPIEDVVTGLVEPYYMELDLAGGKIYWSDVDSPTIHRANLDGTGVENFITGLSRVRDIALDVAGGKIYWGDRLSSTIQRANLDGTGGVEELYGPLDNLDRPHGLALDVEAGKVYWTDTIMNNICRGDMDGSGPVEVLVTGLDGPWGIVVILASPDINKDGDVDMADFSLFARDWSRSECGPCRGADLTGDYAVRADDLSAFAASWLAEP